MRVPGGPAWQRAAPVRAQRWRSLLCAALAGAALIGARRAGAGEGAGELGVNVYGLAHHFDRARAHELGFDNEVNPGLGLRYRGRLGARAQWFIEAGAYRDSGRNTALVAGPGALWHASEHLRLGGALALFASDSYNAGRAFIAPVPVLAWETRFATFNFTYFPRVARLNDLATLGFWITFWPDRR